MSKLLVAVAFHGTKRAFQEDHENAQIDLQLPAAKDLPNGGIKTIFLRELPDNCAIRVRNSCIAELRGKGRVDDHTTWRAFVRKVNGRLEVM